MSGPKSRARLTTRFHEGGETSRTGRFFPPFWAGFFESRFPLRSSPRGFSPSTSPSRPSSSTYTISYSCRISFWRRRRCFRVGIGPSLAFARPTNSAAPDDRRDEVAAEVVGEMTPVRGVEQDEVGVEPRGDPPAAVGAPEHVRGVERAGGQRLGRRQVELGAGDRADE